MNAAKSTRSTKGHSIMRLEDHTSGYPVPGGSHAAEAAGLQGQETNRREGQATTPDGRLIWTVRLDAIDDGT